jgi:hypothetical protein
MKRIATIILTLVYVICIFTACSPKPIHTSFSADGYLNSNYASIQSSLQNDGFTNIRTSPIEDLDLVDADKDGNVISVSIGGNDSFTSQDTFPPDSEVVITYHAVKSVNAPLSSTDAESTDFKSITQMFTDAGFNNVTVTESYDLDPDTIEAEFVNTIDINGVSSFTTGSKFPLNAAINVVHHLPYDKYTVDMHVNFTSNLIFSKYNVYLLLDGTEQSILQHGVDGDYSFRLKEGFHTFTFQNVDDSEVMGEGVLDVTGDINITCKLACYNDHVSIETESYENSNDLSEDTYTTTTLYETTTVDYEFITTTTPITTTIPETTTTPVTTTTPTTTTTPVTTTTPAITTTPAPTTTKPTTTTEPTTTTARPTTTTPKPTTTTPTTTYTQATVNNQQTQMCYWGVTGKKIHKSRNCSTFTYEPYYGTIAEAIAAGHDGGWCKRCS